MSEFEHHHHHHSTEESLSSRVTHEFSHLLQDFSSLISVSPSAASNLLNRMSYGATDAMSQFPQSGDIVQSPAGPAFLNQLGSPVSFVDSAFNSLSSPVSFVDSAFNSLGSPVSFADNTVNSLDSPLNFIDNVGNSLGLPPLPFLSSDQQQQQQPQQQDSGGGIGGVLKTIGSAASAVLPFLGFL